MALANPHIFRQYDIRGVAGRDLTPQVVEALGRAFGTVVRERGGREVLVGRDNRTSSPRLRDDLVRGLVASGCRVLDLGLVVTPILYFAREHWGIEAGVMITGSHNPPEENGFKLALGPGTIHGEEIRRLQRLMEKGLYAGGRGSVERVDAVSPYLAMLAQKIRLGPRPLKVAVDCGNGAAGIFAPRILEAWGCRVVPLYCEPDGTFPHHHPDPAKRANLRELQHAVVEEGCDLGVGYDGDADRLGVVDERGEVIWGDRLMCLFWREILPGHPGAPALVEVKCSQTLVEEIERLGGRPVFCKTGHSLIKARMREMGAPFAGEMSGHMFFADEFYGHDDAFYATGRLLRILSGTDRPLSALTADVPQYCSTAETRIPCPDEVKFAAVARLVEFFKGRYEVVDVDGARVLFAEGWGLVRASNTQPALVARCEARTREGLEKICGLMHEALVKIGGVKPFAWEY